MECTLGGVWSGTPPACKYVDCGTPAQIDHGIFKLLNDTTTHGSVAQYICDDDYWMEGIETVTCNKDGKWFPDTPSCERQYQLIFLMSCSLDSLQIKFNFRFDIYNDCYVF